MASQQRQQRLWFRHAQDRASRCKVHAHICRRRLMRPHLVSPSVSCSGCAALLTASAWTHLLSLLTASRWMHRVEPSLISCSKECHILISLNVTFMAWYATVQKACTMHHRHLLTAMLICSIIETTILVGCYSLTGLLQPIIIKALPCKYVVEVP